MKLIEKNLAAFHDSTDTAGEIGSLKNLGGYLKISDTTKYVARDVVREDSTVPCHVTRVC